MPPVTWRKWFGLSAHEDDQSTQGDFWRGAVLVVLVFLLLFACGWTATLGIKPPKSVNILSNIPVGDYGAWNDITPISISGKIVLEQLKQDTEIPQTLVIPGVLYLTPKVIVAGEGTTTAVSQLNLTSTPSQTPTPTASQPIAPVSSPTATPLASTSTPTQTPTSTASPTKTATRYIPPQPTRTNTPVPTPNTPVPTSTSTHTLVPSITPTPSRTSTATATRTVTLTPTRSLTPTATPTSTSSLTPTQTLTPTSSPSSTVTPSPTSSLTPTASLTPTETLTPVITPTPTATLSPTATQTPIVTIAPPPVGPPDGVFIQIPCGTGTIVDLGASTNDSVLVLYEVLSDPPTIPPSISLDWITLAVNHTGVEPWDQVFYWGDSDTTNNGRIPLSYAIDADGEADNEIIPTSVLYGTPPFQTGIVIDIPASYRPYRYVLISAPLSCGDPAEVDSIQTFPSIP